MKKNAILTCTALAVLFLTVSIIAQPATEQPAEGRGMGFGQGRGQGGAGRGMMGGRGGMGGFGRGGAQTVDFNDFEGFTQIFDGETFEGWDVAEQIWSIQDGAMVATSTQENPAGTTFAIWEDGEVSDFELKLEFKIEGGGNGGVQYRSWRNPNPSMGGFGGGRGGARGGDAEAGGRGQGRGMGADAEIGGRDMMAGRGGGPETGGRGMMAGRGGDAEAGARGGRGGGGGMMSQAYAAWNVAGYQADISGTMTGQLFEGGRFEGERGIATGVGQIMSLDPEGQSRLVGTLGTTQDILDSYEDGQWARYHIIAQGNVLMHIVNGRLVSMTIDNNPARRKSSGIIALQIEGSGLTMSYRNIWLKNL